MTYFASVLRHHQRLLFALTALYLTVIIVAFGPVQAMHIWLIAAVFCMIVNYTCVTEARGSRVLFRFEGLMASVLIGAAIFGVVISPGFAVLAILGQALWGLSRRPTLLVDQGNWALMGAFTVEAVYGAVLLLYWLNGA